MKNIAFKILFLAFILNIGLLPMGGETLAFFNDGLAVNDNFFSAGVLEMTLRSGQSNFVPDAETMQPGQQINRDIYLGKTADSAPLQYQVSYEFLTGEENLCQQMDLKIWYNHYHGSPAGGYGNRDMRLKYEGKLSDLSNLTDEDFIIPHPDDKFDLDDSNGTEQWFYYSLTLPENIPGDLEGKTCRFNLTFQSWQTNFEYYGEGGFTDEKKIESTITGQWTPDLSSIGDKSGQEGELLSFTVEATDPNGDSLTYSASNLPSGASFNSSTRTFQWTPSAGDMGTYAGVHFEVSDGKYVSSEDITITISELPSPEITNIEATNITSSSVDITWNTDQSATSKVEYGLDTNYGSTTAEDSTLVGTHTVSISGLSSAPTYYYQVSSKNHIGKETTSGDNSFATLN